MPGSVAEVLRSHVVLEVEGIDRMYLNMYVPRLQTVEGVLGFIRRHRGHKVASTAMVEPITRAFVTSIERFVSANGIPLLSFEKGQRKGEIAARFRAAFKGKEGILFVGKAQEKCRVYRETAQSAHRRGLRVDREIERAGEPLLLLLRGLQLRAILPEVLFVFSLQREAVPQRA
jgi:hypothetical protein